MLALAGPVVMAELGWVTMGIVDTVMVGGLGASAIGAVGLASTLFFAIAVFAMGLLLGLDSFRHDLEIEPVTEVDDGADECFGFRPLAEARHEAAVDLELVDR